MRFMLDSNARKRLFLLFNEEALTLGGRSLWFNSADEWKMINEQTQQLLNKDKSKKLNLTLSFEMIDTQSVPRLMEYIKLFRSKSSGKLIWKYDVEDMRELGRDLENVLSIPFQYKACSEPFSS